MSAAGSTSRQTTGATRKVSIGATSSAFERRSRGSTRSQAATDRSTRYEGPTTSRFGHDLSLPYLMVQRGRRAVYEPAANAYEKATPTTEDEYRRKVRMFEHCWAIVLEGKMLRRLRPLYLIEVLSHRHLRYASGLLHLVLLGTSIALLGDGTLYAVVLGLQLGVLAAALLGVGLPRYYVLVTWATVQALVNYLRHGVPTTWDPAEGTR